MADAPDCFDSFEEVQDFVRKQTESYNQTPQDELGGLSPEQAFMLLNSAWESPDFPLQFNQTLPLDRLEDGSRFFRNCRRFLSLAQDQDGLERTQKGNLNRKVVAELMDCFDLPDGERDAILAVNKTINEHDVRDIHLVRIVCETAGMIYPRKARFRIPKDKAKLLAPDRAGEPFVVLVQGYFRKFSMAYLDRYPDCPGVQHCIAYTLLQLCRLEDDWHDYREVLPRLFLPSVMQEAEDACSGPYTNTDAFLETRVFSHLVRWGFLEARYCRDEGAYVDRIAALRPTPLLRDAIQVSPSSGI